MSQQGKENCPLCMEEMDSTDRQLKPCKCGYEICVWCWHQIMEMADIDDIGGRCPACRALYDKERILDTTISWKRLEEHQSKKQKSCKAKPIAADVQNDLGTVRVIQRNLVYITGIPINIANEETLKKKVYLGQYGKIERIIIDNIRKEQFPNSCRVFVTFSKDDEAFRCIQAVNGYYLDGRPLKANFGATKYCSVWLTNRTCRKPSCPYMHRLAPQEDICTKDGISSACASKLEHFSGATLDISQRHSGNTLPPPIDKSNGRNCITCGECLPSLNQLKCSRHVGKELPKYSKNSGAPWSLIVASGRSSSDNPTSPREIDQSTVPNKSLISSTDSEAQTSSGNRASYLYELSESIVPPRSSCEDALTGNALPNLKAKESSGSSDNAVRESSCLAYIDILADRIAQCLCASGSNEFIQGASVCSPNVLQCPTGTSDSPNILSWVSECLEESANGKCLSSNFSGSSAVACDNAVWRPVQSSGPADSGALSRRVFSPCPKDCTRHNTGLEDNLHPIHKINQGCGCWYSDLGICLSAREGYITSICPMTNIRTGTVCSLLQGQAVSSLNPPLSCHESNEYSSSRLMGTGVNLEDKSIPNYTDTILNCRASKHSMNSDVSGEASLSVQGITRNDSCNTAGTYQHMGHYTDTALLWDNDIHDLVDFNRANVCFRDNYIYHFNGMQIQKKNLSDSPTSSLAFSPSTSPARFRLPPPGFPPKH